MKIKNLTKTCNMCPSQWEAETLDNKSVYIRYRWGYLKVLVGEKEESLFDFKEIFAKQIGDELDGVLETDEMLRITGLINE